MQKDFVEYNKMDVQLQEKVLKEYFEFEEDFVDVGINIQIVVEVMSVLLFVFCIIEEVSELEMRD